MEGHWKEETLNLIILDILRQKGFSKTNKYAFEILKDVLVENLKRLMLKVKSFAEMDQRSEVTVFDLLNVLRANDYDLEELESFISESQGRIEAPSTIVSSKLIRNHQGVYRDWRLQHQTQRCRNRALSSLQAKKNIIELPNCFRPNIQRQRKATLHCDAR